MICEIEDDKKTPAELGRWLGARVKEMDVKNRMSRLGIFLDLQVALGLAGSGVQKAFHYIKHDTINRIVSELILYADSLAESEDGGALGGNSLHAAPVDSVVYNAEVVGGEIEH